MLGEAMPTMYALVADHMEAMHAETLAQVASELSQVSLFLMLNR